MKKLADILQDIPVVQSIGNTDTNVQDISMDSRNVSSNSLFIAVKGTVTDGHLYIDKAIKNGAIAVVCEIIPRQRINRVTYIQINDSVGALGVIASAFFGHPSRQMDVIGITGTNGKTTVATLLYHTFIQNGQKSGLISTVKIMINQHEVAATHTTPDAISIQRVLRQMLDEQCKYCFMEVSSHAIHQKRIAGMKFKGGVFTNITHEHLDYHGTYKNYLDVKKTFFDNLPSGTFALTNIDDKNGKIIIQNTNAEVFTCGLKKMADYKGKVIESDFSGMLLDINNKQVWTSLNGTFNAYNLVAVYAVSCILGMNEDNALQIMSSMKNVEGRFEHIYSKSNIHVIIDYAHTPDALKNVLETINHIKKDADKKIITVVGAGGDKDREKRSEMGKIAANFSNKVIFTSDNPRNEEPEAIIKDMMQGVTAKKHHEVIAIINRYEAIKTASMLAGQGDVILIAGKGHEKYQEIKEVRYPFNDKEVVNEVLNINQRVC